MKLKLGAGNAILFIPLFELKFSKTRELLL